MSILENLRLEFKLQFDKVKQTISRSKRKGELLPHQQEIMDKIRSKNIHQTIAWEKGTGKTIYGETEPDGRTTRTISKSARAEILRQDPGATFSPDMSIVYTRLDYYQLSDIFDNHD